MPEQAYELLAAQKKAGVSECQVCIVSELFLIVIILRQDGDQ